MLFYKIAESEFDDLIAKPIFFLTRPIEMIFLVLLGKKFHSREPHVPKLKLRLK